LAAFKNSLPAEKKEKIFSYTSLREWARRLWTFPEVLLGPNLPLVICWKDNCTIKWYELEKRQFPSVAWEDGESARQLVDSYGAGLSRLEFGKIALECLIHRAREADVDLFYDGDVSYVLMGFLRLRPIINKFDSALQAFARYVTKLRPKAFRRYLPLTISCRLSLPADSDRLMERFVALQPPSPTADWALMEDGYNASIWSIEPSIQISGVGENDTLIIEKAWGAKIELSRFTDVCSSKVGFLRHAGGVLAGLAIYPKWMAHLAAGYRKRKFEETYPRLFGFEGFMSIDEIEERLFGAPSGILKWSMSGSVLSRHYPGQPILEPRGEFSSARYAVQDLEAQNVQRDSGELIRDGRRRIKTYPVITQEPWAACDEHCGCVAPNFRNHPTRSELEKIGRSNMGEQKVCIPLAVIA
jgi:hypothetical protein